ncbi:hypothetical protein STEG23_009941, partial [Scotinomys teguina]
SSLSSKERDLMETRVFSIHSLHSSGYKFCLSPGRYGRREERLLKNTKDFTELSTSSKSEASAKYWTYLEIGVMHCVIATGIKPGTGVVLQ